MSTSTTARRWRKLGPTTQWAMIYGLLCDIRRREYKLKTWKGRGEGGPLNKTKSVQANARDRALLDLLRAVTPADVWDDAEKHAAEIAKSYDDIARAGR